MDPSDLVKHVARVVLCLHAGAYLLKRVVFEARSPSGDKGVATQPRARSIANKSPKRHLKENMDFQIGPHPAAPGTLRPAP
jgi:hypothetical protein